MCDWDGPYESSVPTEHSYRPLITGDFSVRDLWANSFTLPGDA